jgi:hypothetical protein
MEKIELRSEKVRNIIGIVPPFIVRAGNLSLFLLVIILLVVSSLVRVPVKLHCSAVTEINNDSIVLHINSMDKLLTEPIDKGKLVNVYKNDRLLFTGTTIIALTKVNLYNDGIKTVLPLKVNREIYNNNMKYVINDELELICEILLDDRSIFENIIHKK